MGRRMLSETCQTAPFKLECQLSLSSAPLAQWIEYQASNLRVPCSSHGGCTTSTSRNHCNTINSIFKIRLHTIRHIGALKCIEMHVCLSEKLSDLIFKSSKVSWDSILRIKNQNTIMTKSVRRHNWRTVQFSAPDHITDLTTTQGRGVLGDFNNEMDQAVYGYAPRSISPKPDGRTRAHRPLLLPFDGNVWRKTRASA